MAIVDSVMKKPADELAIKPAPDEYKAPAVAPVTTEVDAGTETVESRLNDLTAKGSKYTNLAKSDAQREANTRGLINSTMAGAAGVDAAIRAGLPIAQQDAKTYTDTRFNNQAAQNEFGINRQSASLNKEVAGHESQLQKGEMQLGSDLTNQQNTLSNQLQINRDINSAALNENLATLESSLQSAEMTLDAELKTEFEQTMNDERFSDEMKLQIVSTMNNIIRDSQQQTVEVGLSDRTAAQQAAAIELIRAQRDAELAVYQDLLGTFNDWDWGTNFTPETATPPAPPAPAPAYSGGGGGGGGGDDRSCFTGDTIVTLYDGTEKLISDVEIGDALLGMGDTKNIVLEFDHPLLGDRALFSINDSSPFVTSEHPFMTSTGWKSINPIDTAKENPNLDVETMLIGDYLEQIGNPLIKVQNLSSVGADSETQLYNFKLSGNRTYYANSFLVHNKSGD